MSSQCETTAKRAAGAPMSVFERYLTVWVFLCIVVGIGLGALIAASSLAFTVVKWAGVAYLVWLGIKQWRAPAAPLVAADGEAAAVSRRDLYLRGWIVNALNPKGTVFLLAVVPQFLDLARPLPAQYAVIALTLAFTDLVVMAGYTALASRVLRALKAPSHIKAMNRSFGALFVLAGTLPALFVDDPKHDFVFSDNNYGQLRFVVNRSELVRVPQ